ncbi:MAG: hypothetical protein ABIA63_10305 [bacterium]
MNIYKAVLEPLSSFGTPLLGDMIWGHVCWALRYLEGERAVNDFITAYDSSMPLAVSDGFFSGCLPVPVTAPPPQKHWDALADKYASKNGAKKSFEAIKKYRRVTQVSSKILDPILDSFTLTALIDSMMDADTIDKEGIISRSVPRNTIDRMRGTASAFFTSEERFYYTGSDKNKKSAEFDVYFLCGQEFPVERLKPVLEYIEREGYGRDRSTGRGHFRVNSLKEIKFRAVGKANAVFSLCSFVPAKNDPPPHAYKVQPRFGRLGGEWGSAQNPFKNGVALLGAGSTLLCDGGIKPAYGHIIKNIHADTRIRQYGIMLAHPVRLEDI